MGATGGKLIAGGLVVLWLFSAAALAAQQTGERPHWVSPDAQLSPDREDERDPDWLPVQPRDPDPGHERRVEVHSLRHGVQSISLDNKLSAIRRIEELHHRGEFQPWDRDIMAVLHYAATEGVTYRISDPGRPAPSYPLARMRAVQLLGTVGGPYARSTVLEVIRWDDESVVLSEAASALARMRAETDDELITHLTGLIERMRRTTHDERLAWSILNAVQELDRHSWGMQDPALFRAILTLAQAPYSLRVQRRAIEVIDLLRRAP